MSIHADEKLRSQSINELFQQLTKLSSSSRHTARQNIHTTEKGIKRLSLARKTLNNNKNAIGSKSSNIRSNQKKDEISNPEVSTTDMAKSSANSSQSYPSSPSITSADDTFDTSKFYEMMSPEDLSGSPFSGPAVPNIPGSPNTPKSAKDGNSTIFTPTSRVGRNCGHVNSSPVSGASAWASTDSIGGLLDNSAAFSRKLSHFDSQGELFHSEAQITPSRSSITSSPGSWQKFSPTTSSRGNTTQTSRFFPAHSGSVGNLMAPQTVFTNPTAVCSLDSLDTGGRANSGGFFMDNSPSLRAANNLSLGSPSFNYNMLSMQASSTDQLITEPMNFEAKHAQHVSSGSLDQAMQSAQRAAASVLDEEQPADMSIEAPAFVPAKKSDTKHELTESSIPTVSKQELRTFLRKREHPDFLQVLSTNEIRDDHDTINSENVDNTIVSLPSVQLQSLQTASSTPHASVIKYIRRIITRQPTLYMIYIASLPYDTPETQCRTLIKGAFKNYGEITNVVKDEHCKWSKVAPENDLFVRFRIVVKLFNEQRLPYKSHRFFNEITGRDSKMLLFFDCSSSSPTGHLDQENANGGGYSKQDVSVYPEGFASTFHKRGLNNFMFVRELQSKMIINKVRLNNNTTAESAEFRVSLPVEELDLDPYSGEGQSYNSRYADSDYRRFKRSYVVNIDVRELENRQPTHHNGGRGAYSNNNDDRDSKQQRYYNNNGNRNNIYRGNSYGYKKSNRTAY